MKGLQVGTPIYVDDLHLIPVETTYLRADHGHGFLMVVAVKEPVAVVIRSGRRIWALDIEGREASVSQLLHEVDGLGEWVS